MENSKYKIAQTSIQGLSHKKNDPAIPCQDAGKSGILDNGLSIIIVSDGAGSSKLSHIASDFCVNSLYSKLNETDFSLFISTPSDLEFIKNEWQKSSLNLFDNVRMDLLDKAKKEDINVADLNCTLILLIKTAWGFLSANIGDGRSGFSDGKPHSLTVPFMTFTAGATYFLIKEGWNNIFISYISISENPDKIEYFFATSDGCQDFVIDWSLKGPKNGIYDDVLGNEAFYDNNLPYQPFFEGLIKSLNEVDSNEDRNERLRKLVEQGIYQLNGEEKELKSISSPLLDDDKTFILFYK